MFTTLLLAALLSQEPAKSPTPRIVIRDEIMSVFYVDAAFPSGMKIRVPVLNGILPYIEVVYVKERMDSCEFIYARGIPFTGRPTAVVRYTGTKPVKVAQGEDEVFRLSPLPPMPDELLKKPSEVEK